MENNLQIFNYNDSAVRTVQKDGEPWFVLKDVCSVLGIGNSRMAADRLEVDEKGVSQIDTPGGTQDITIISESGLYAVILRSDKPEAKPFRKWVTSEVLPSIRKHGAYMTPDTLEAAANDPDYVSKLVDSLSAETARRKQLEDKIQNDAAKVLLVETACSAPVSVSAYADFISRNTEYKLQGDDLFRFFKRLGYCTGPNFFPENESPYFLINEQATSSLVPGSTHIHKSVLITPEGQLFFLDKILSAAVKKAAAKTKTN